MIAVVIRPETVWHHFGRPVAVAYAVALFQAGADLPKVLARDHIGRVAGHHQR